MKTMHYNQSANKWKEALPLGNSKTGIMIYGGKQVETLCFNDVTLWSGYPKDYNSKTSFEYLDKVRNLIFEGKNHKADKLAEKKLHGEYSETYLPLGNTYLDFNGTLNEDEYERSLDLEKAIHTVSTKGVNREAFASFPAQVFVYKITADKEFSCNIKMDSPLHYEVSTDGGMNLYGNAPDMDAPNYHKQFRPTRYNEHKAMAFCLRMEVETNGDVKQENNITSISNATEATLYFVTSTGFKSFKEMPITDTKVVIEKCKEALKNVNKDYEALKKEHIDDYFKLYNRSSITFNTQDDDFTDNLKKKVKEGGNLAPLSELVYNYGKYLLIAGSRKGGQPLNLQGIWNSEVRPPWSSNYTVNINTEMNYWGASRCGLSECIEPLISMVYELVENGKKTAKINYNCEGFCCNHNVDIWRMTSPCKGSCSFMLAPLCGIWLANEVYNHYLDGELDEYKDKIVEIVEEAAKFIRDYLVMHDGNYVICPSTSPENSFRLNGKQCFLDYATAYDISLSRQALKNVLEISDDEELKAQAQEKLEKLYPFKKGETGICEYHKSYDIVEKGHRHFSPLYGFYPEHQICYYRDEEKTQWVKELFDYRMNHANQHIGWSAAWAICLASRLRDASTAKKVIKDLLSNAIFSNLFCYHPPTFFQIDGNFGFIASVNEMVLTEEDGKIELLPAIPDDFKNGSVKNLVIKGAKISFEFKDGKVISIESDKEVNIINKNLDENVKLNDNVKIIEL